MRRLIQFFGILFLTHTQLLASDVADRFIRQYKDLAISEMQRTGIPASIKLAQGILESDFGRSDLAVEANNHFGIKCGGSWVGSTYHKEDDDYKNGRLVKSCFRKYDNDVDSWLAHSEFLKQSRYERLFRLRSHDYKGWARGLRQAGYATHPQYSQKLIGIIERYQLFRFDDVQPELPELIVSEERTEPTTPSRKREPVATPQPQPEQPSVGGDQRMSQLTIVKYVNDAKVTYSLAGETLTDISKRTDVSVNTLIKYNELLTSSSATLKTGMPVFLQPKRSANRGKEVWHEVKPGETMFDIAQQYGIRLDKLYERNLMKEETQPAIRERILLKGKRTDTPNLRTNAAVKKDKISSATPKIQTPENEPIATPTSRMEGDEPLISTEEEDVVWLDELEQPMAEQSVEPTIESPFEDLDVSAELETADRPVSRNKERVIRAEKPVETVKEKPIVVSRTTYYVVQSKDTLFGIARKYDISVEELRSWNRLDGNTIHPNQRLRVK